MTTLSTVFIPCAAGSRVQTDFLICPRGDLVEIIGHPIMHVTPQDARKAAAALLAIADQAEGRESPNTALESRV